MAHPKGLASHARPVSARTDRSGSNLLASSVASPWPTTPYKSPPLLGGFCMARPKGFEPMTSSSVDSRSIQLSYGRTGCVCGQVPPLCQASKWCGQEDSNLHGSPRQPLKLVRLPIPPYPQRALAGWGLAGYKAPCNPLPRIPGPCPPGHLSPTGPA